MEEVKKETTSQAEERMDAPGSELLVGLSDDVKAKLDTAISDMEVCKILADAGVDLVEVAGGFYDDFLEDDLDCDCGADNCDDFSRQYWLGMVRRGRFIVITGTLYFRAYDNKEAYDKAREYYKFN